MWDGLLLDMEAAKMNVPSKEDLFRHYITKLKPELRTTILSQDLRVDGSDRAARRCVTYQDAGKAVNLMTDQCADTTATGSEQIYNIRDRPQPSPLPSNTPANATGGGGPAGTCKHCQAVNAHLTQYCPQKAAEKRGEDVKCRALNQSRGLVCTYQGCGAVGHQYKHHQQAIDDYIASQRQSQPVPETKPEWQRPPKKKGDKGKKGTDTGKGGKQVTPNPGTQPQALSLIHI